MATNGTDYPARLEIEYPESPSRVWALTGVIFVKGIFLIPHQILLAFLTIASWIVMYIGFWAVLITGSYPRGLFNFQVGVQRWSLRTSAWSAGWTDRYPPFTLS